MRRTFLVGRVTPKGEEMVVLKGAETPPFPGPWTLKAVVRPLRSPFGPGRTPRRRAH
jgi:hypothetical protein